MDESNMPRGLPGQAEAPEVRAALERSHDPVLQVGGGGGCYCLELLAAG